MKGISVLIPTYNRPKFLRRALLSVLSQTRLPDEIIISDDNPESEENFNSIKDLLQEYDKLIKYQKNKTRLGVKKNYLKLLEEANYEYIKFLADDDWLHPEALELMERALNKYEEVSVVSSVRLPVNKDNEIIWGIKSTNPLSSKDEILDGKSVIKKSIVDLCNYVGEFSTYMFRKSLLDINPFKFCDIDFRANADWALWMYLLSKGNLFYYSRPLSFFCSHENQDQRNIEVRISGYKERKEFVLNEKIQETLGIKLTEADRAKAMETLFSYLSLDPNLLEEHSELLSDILSSYEIFLKKNYSTNCNSTAFERRFPVSIIIVTYNSSKTIIPLLKSLKKSISIYDELVIVDNNSLDDTLALVENFVKLHNFENLKIISLKENIGYAAAINKGVKASNHEFLVFVNPDVILPEFWIETVYKYLEKKDVGAVGAISNFVADFQHLERFSAICFLMNKKRLMKYIDLVDKHLKALYQNSFEVRKFLIGFFLATKREVFEEVGGFDSDLFLGMDDLDFSLKLREKEYKLILPKDLFIFHEGHVSFKSSEDSEKKKEVTENLFAEKLIKKFGFGNVPTPEELWRDGRTIYFSYFVPTGSKYKFMFKFVDNKINYEEIAKEILRKPTVGIVTVSYFSSQDIKVLADSLNKQKYQNFYWYIIDHSQDKEELRSLRLATSKLKERVIILEKENRGFAAGTNLGIDLAIKNGAEYIWILNPDTELEPNTMLELIKTSLFTGIPAVTCKIKDSKEREKLQYDGFKASYIPFLDYPQRIHWITFLSGANIFVKSDLLIDIRFNENYFMYFEDNEFFDDLRKKGIIPIYTPYTSIYHKNKEGNFKGQEVYYYYRNMIHFYIKKGAFPLYLFEKLRCAYDSLYYKKSSLRYLIVAVYDAVSGKMGKKNPIYMLPDRRRLEQYLREFLDVRKVSKLMALKFAKDYLLLKPRDRDIFEKYLDDVLQILLYQGRKLWEKR